MLAYFLMTKTKDKINILFCKKNSNLHFRSDMKSVALVLAHSSQDDVNAPVSPRDSRSPLHLAASLGSLAIAQLLIWVSHA